MLRFNMILHSANRIYYFKKIGGTIIKKTDCLLLKNQLAVTTILTKQNHK